MNPDPQPTTLYRIFDVTGELLYVGITNRFERRLADHMDKPWYRTGVRVLLTHFSNRKAALEAEKETIMAEKPRHNVVHNNGEGKRPPTTGNRRNRIANADDKFLDPRSLVGSFFHSGADRGWQGAVVAEPSPGWYLVELFDWLVGASSNQRLVRIEEMRDWVFYDTSEWMNNCSAAVEIRWKQERSEEPSLS